MITQEIITYISVACATCGVMILEKEHALWVHDPGPGIIEDGVEGPKPGIYHPKCASKA